MNKDLMSVRAEQSVLHTVNNMAIQSLPPEQFVQWEAIKDILESNRHLKEDESDMHELGNRSLEVLQSFDGLDFRPTGHDVQPLHQRGTIVYFRLGRMMPSLPAFINGRHQLDHGKWKYTISIAVLTEEGYEVARLTNVDEQWLLSQP